MLAQSVGTERPPEYGSSPYLPTPSIYYATQDSGGSLRGDNWTHAAWQVGALEELRRRLGRTEARRDELQQKVAEHATATAKFREALATAKNKAAQAKVQPHICPPA